MAAIEKVQRPDYRYTGSEAEILAGMLDRCRSTLVWKCQGLTSDQLRHRSVRPSVLSLLDLLRHLTEAERYWFQVCIAGRAVEPLYKITSQGYVASGDQTPADEVLRNYQAACAESRKILAAETLERETHTGVYGRTVSVRFIAVHLVEEYSRHNGHADLLRESIDGITGE